MVMFKKAFTIVELLIVIVVIGILAVIIVVSYNGITNSAQLASIQSDMVQQARKLRLYSVQNNDTYPANFTAANTAGFLKDTSISSGTSIDWRSDHYLVSPDRKNYCASVSILSGGKDSADLTYSISSTSGGQPIKGICVENLATNPGANPDGNTNEWQVRFGSNGSWPSSSGSPVSNLKYYRRQTIVTEADNAGGRGTDHNGNTDVTPWTAGSYLAWPVTSGQQLTISSYIRSSESVAQARLQCKINNGAGAWVGSTIYSPEVAYVANNWQRLVTSFTASSTGYLVCSSRLQANINWLVGDTIDTTGLMLTVSSTLFSYGDGDSPGWFWTGTPNNSTSIGPALFS